MLYLQAGVHFQEIKTAIACQHKFHRARAYIVNRPRCGDGGCAHACAQGFVHRRAGRFFHHFLVTPLHRTIALAYMHHMRVPITKDLNFYMAGVQHGFFDEQLPVAKSVSGLATRGSDAGQQIRRILHQAHTAPAPACCGLHHDRQA